MPIYLYISRDKWAGLGGYSDNPHFLHEFTQNYQYIADFFARQN